MVDLELKAETPTRADEHHPGDEQVAAFVVKVGHRVRQARQQKAISRRELSERSGVSQRYLAQLEGGAGNISVALLFRVATALGHLPDRLLGTGDPWDPEAADFLSLFRSADADRRRRVMDILGPTEGNEAKMSRICLVGLRGAGKSTLGKLLTEDLSTEFVELNHLIEEQSGMPVGEVMALYGEEGYRRLERKAIDSVIDTANDVVLSAAGGIVSDPETFGRLLRRFHTCWLKAQPEEHMARVRQQGDERPMAGNPKAMDDLKSILTSRESLYAKADVVVDTSGKTVAESRDELLIAIRRHGL